MDFDMSWRDPTEVQLAALDHVCAILGVPEKEHPKNITISLHQQVMIEASRKAYAVDVELYQEAGKLSLFDYAEMILMADQSLWYTQAKRWAEGNTPGKDSWGKDVAMIFAVAGQAIVKIVDWGYQDGKWWNLEAIYPNTTHRATAICFIIEANRLIRVVNTPTSAYDLVTRLMPEGAGYFHSSGLHVFPQLLVPKLNIKYIKKLLSEPNGNGAQLAIAEIAGLFDPAIRKVVNSAKRKAKQEISQTYEPTKCIKPDCENLVAPPGITPREGHYKNYRGTGACQKGHNGYQCSKCGRPHSYASKIGQQHYKYRAQVDE
jgi:hypothetical protein